MLTVSAVYELAVQCCNEFGDGMVRTTHLMACLFRQLRDERPALMQHVLGVSVDRLEVAFLPVSFQFATRLRIGSETPPWTPTAARILQWLINEVGPDAVHPLLEEHLLLAIIKQPEPDLARALDNAGVNRDRAVELLSAHISRIEQLHKQLNEARKLHETGEYERAIKKYALVIEAEPAYAPAYYFRGHSWESLGRPDKAIEDFTKAIELQPGAAEAYHARARLKVLLSDPTGAGRDLDKAIELNPGEAVFFVSRGELYLEVNDLDRARNDFEKAVSLAPDFTTALYKLGVVLMKSGEVAAARRNLSRAVALGHSDAQAYLQRHGRVPGLVSRAMNLLWNRERATLRPWLKTLAGSDASARSEAVRKLGESRSVEATRALLRVVQRRTDPDRAEAVTALGLIADHRSAITLLDISVDKAEESPIRQRALEALARIRDPRAIPAWIPMLKHDARLDGAVSIGLGRFGSAATKSLEREFARTHDPEVQRAIIAALRHIGQPEATRLLLRAMEIPELRNDAAAAVEQLEEVETAVALPYLTNWSIGRAIVKPLLRSGWEVKTNADAVHVALALREGRMLREDWETTHRVLLEDVGSPKYVVVENALYGFIGLGRDEIIGTLIKKLNANGTKVMAEAFLNCGEDRLADAATAWAAAHGYTIKRGSGVAPVHWGGL